MKKQIAFGSLLLSVLPSFAQTKPNVVVLFVDDLGWADLGYRNPIFHTPNIDQLRADGMEFTRAYIATPTSSPSRASILTGKEPVRFQMVRHIDESEENGFDINGRTTQEYGLWKADPVQMPSRNWLPLEEVTYAERLKESGYYNMFVGKWHLGQEEYWPTKQGFDAQYGTSNWGHPGSYYAPFFKHANPMTEVPEGEYLTDVLTNKALGFIRNYDKKEPFSLSFFYYSVHGPQKGRKDYVQRYLKEGLTGKYAEYAGMISTVDESVGKIRAELKKKGIADNTVILFTSDQGGFFTNAPLSGGKTGGNTLGEGGARVPFIAYYPGKTKAGSSTDTPIQTIDVYPTLVEIASGKKCADKGINGKSLMPLIKGEKFPARDLFCFRSYEDQYASIVSGDWKMIKYHSGKYEMFNIKNDIAEKDNLIDKDLKQAKLLKKKLNKWEKKAVPAY